MFSYLTCRSFYLICRSVRPARRKFGRPAQSSGCKAEQVHKGEQSYSFDGGASDP